MYNFIPEPSGTVTEGEGNERKLHWYLSYQDKGANLPPPKKNRTSLEIKKSYDQLSILKRRDIILPTSLVKAMVFPVVMYGCENWTIRKLSAKELMLLNCGVGGDS